MRVLHVAAGNLYGGVERILEEIARHAPPASRHAFALSFSGRLSSGLVAAGAAPADLGGARFSRPLSVWRARRRLRRVLRASSFDVVVGHSPWAYALAAPAVARERMVLWAHDALEGAHWTERRVSARPPAMVVCNSHYTAAAVATWLPDVRREVVYAPVSMPPHETTSRAGVRAALGAAPGTAVVLIASRFERWKGHADLLRAAATLRGDWTIWIAGGAQRPHELEYAREMHALAAGLPPERVVFLGDRTDMPRVFAAADIHCQPNATPEPFGLVFVEALSAGIPVVTSDFGGAREIVTPACGVLLPTGDPSALARTLQGLIDDPARRAALGAAGPSRARALCDPSTQMAALERALA